MNEIPDPILDAPVTGTNLVPGRLRDQIGEGPHLLVFLRHFGCIFCRETVADLRARSGHPDFPPVLFFTQAGSTELRAFLRRDWPGARAIADPGRHFYAAFDVDRMSPLGLLRPALWRAERRARSKGHENGDERVGDIWRMPGVFLVEHGRVLWSHPFRHAGDHPDWDRIPPLAATLRASGAGAHAPGASTQRVR